MHSYYNKKVCVVTGAASGIGAALCEQLVQCGAVVIAIDIDEKGLEKLVVKGKASTSIIADVTNFKAMQGAAKQLFVEFGSIDLWFNNVGIAMVGELHQVPPKQFDQIIDVNLRGQLNGIYAVYSHMVEQGDGQIVNVGSIAGVLPSPFQIPYVTSKYALTGLTLALRMEARGLNIKVNLVCPGGVDTDIWESARVTESPIKSPEELKSLFFWRPKLLSSNNAAVRILRGVKKDHPIIFTDKYTKTFWFINRLFPKFWLWLYGRHTTKVFRNKRT